MRMPTRLKTRLDSLIKTRLSSVVERHFRRNEGTTDYATIPTVTLNGDFVIEFDIYMSSISESIILSESLRFFSFLRIDTSGSIRFRAGIDASIATVVGVVTANTLTRIIISRVGGSISANVGGVDYAFTGSDSDPFIIDQMLKYGDDGSITEGILTNLRIWDNGTLIRDYQLDEPKGTSVIYDTVGGNNGAIVNGNDEDKGLFTQQTNGDWKGNGLTVPPWDSVDQILVKA